MIQTLFNILEFGARGDAATPSGSAINAALQACEKEGGGRVVVPAGEYLCGPLELRSGVELHLEEGALIQFSSCFDDFPLCHAFYEGRQTVRCRSPLWGENLHDVAVTGAGIFDGAGQAWRPVKKFKMTPDQWDELCASGGVVDEAGEVWWPTVNAMNGDAFVRNLRASGRDLQIEEFAPARDFLRPSLVQLAGCQGVTLDGPTFRNSPAWNVHLLMCENVQVRNCTILNPWYAQNGDGLDIESCRDVEVRDCTFDVGDDAICLKSGKDAEGRRLNRPCQNITIANCSVLHGHGGVVVGSEMSGGVRDVRVENCDFRGTDIGLRFKTCRGRGGAVENIEIRDVTMSDIVGPAISFDMFYGGFGWGEGDAYNSDIEAVNEGTPIIRNVSIRNVSCQRAGVAIEMRGLPEMPIENLRLSDIRIESERGVQLRNVKDVTISHVQVAVAAQPALEVRNVDNLSLVEFCGETRNEENP